MKPCFNNGKIVSLGVGFGSQKNAKKMIPQLKFTTNLKSKMWSANSMRCVRVKRERVALLMNKSK